MSHRRRSPMRKVYYDAPAHEIVRAVVCSQTHSCRNTNGGKLSLASDGGAVAVTHAQLVDARDTDGAARLYVNGVQNVSTVVGGSLSNEVDGSRTWVGELYKVVVKPAKGLHLL